MSKVKVWLKLDVSPLKETYNTLTTLLSRKGSPTTGRCEKRAAHPNLIWQISENSPEDRFLTILKAQERFLSRIQFPAGRESAKLIWPGKGRN